MKKKWKCMRSLADYRSIFITKADKGLCAAVWDREDYLGEAEKNLSDKNGFKEVNLKRALHGLARASNGIFKVWKEKIREKELEYFTINHKKITYLGKMYLLPKIHKRLHSVPWRPVISYCGTLIEKVSEFLIMNLNLSPEKVCLTLKILIIFCCK